MQPRKAKYPIKQPLVKILNHKNLPDCCTDLAQIKNRFNDNYLITLIKNDGYLSIVKSRTEKLSDDTERYFISQTDFPFEFLQWFSSALKEFREPTKKTKDLGGMSSSDKNVGSEMLCIQRCMDAGNKQPGYAFMNRSRENHKMLSNSHFRSQEIIFEEDFIFEGGLLDLIDQLALSVR